MTASGKISLQALTPLAQITDVARDWRVEATPDELSQLTLRLKVGGVKSFSGEVKAVRRSGDIIIDGVVAAELQRICTASLEPMIETIEEAFRLRLSREFTEDDAASEEDVDLLADHIAGTDGGAKADAINFGEILAQQAAMAMSPHPRRDDVQPLLETLDPEEKPNPFAVLASLKSKDD